MAFVAVNRNDSETIFNSEPFRTSKYWDSNDDYVDLPTGSIEKLIGRKLTWDDDPVEI